MKTRTYFNIFKIEEYAYRRMVIKNRVSQNGTIFCLLDHPDGWAVMDLKSAIETELPYKWSLI